jgi:hypothetical protein
MKGRNQRKMGTGWKKREIERGREENEEIGKEKKKERDEMKKKVPLRAGWEEKNARRKR